MQAGAQVAILHLQRYAYMQLEALRLCQAPPGCHADCVRALSTRSCQLFSTSGSQAMAPAELISGLMQVTHIRPPQVARCQEVQQLGHGISMHDRKADRRAPGHCAWAAS